MGQKYANYDTSTGKILGYYDDDIHTEEQISDNSIEITDEEWKKCISAQNGYYKVNLDNFNLQFVDTTPSEQELFETKQQSMINQLKTNANAVIESRFPQHHQINLLDGTKNDIPDGWDSSVRVSDYAVIKEFKQNIIAANNTIEDSITVLSYPTNSIEDLEAIGISQDDIKIEAGY